MAQPQPTSDAFNEERYSGNITPLSSSEKKYQVSNVGVEYKKPANDNRKFRVVSNSKKDQLVDPDDSKYQEKIFEPRSRTQPGSADKQKLTPQEQLGNLKSRVKIVRSAAVFSGGFIFLWLTCQVWFAIATLCFLGLAYGVRVGANEVYASMTSDLIPDLIDVTLAEWVVSVGEPAVAMMDGLFFISWVTVIILGLIQIFGLMLVATFSGAKAVSGEGAIFKIAALLASVIGYCAPGLNLLPWVGLYALALLWYPK